MPTGDFPMTMVQNLPNTLIADNDYNVTTSSWMSLASVSIDGNTTFHIDGEEVSIARLRKLEAKFTCYRRFCGKLGYELPLEGMTADQLDTFMHDNNLWTTENDGQTDFEKFRKYGEKKCEKYAEKVQKITRFDKLEISQKEVME